MDVITRFVLVPAACVRCPQEDDMNADITTNVHCLFVTGLYSNGVKVAGKGIVVELHTKHPGDTKPNI